MASRGRRSGPASGRRAQQGPRGGQVRLPAARGRGDTAAGTQLSAARPVTATERVPHHHAFEVRYPSYFTAEFYDLPRAHDVGFVVAVHAPFDALRLRERVDR